jgi:hypothetical protein
VKNKEEQEQEGEGEGEEEEEEEQEQQGSVANTQQKKDCALKKCALSKKKREYC